MKQPRLQSSLLAVVAMVLLASTSFGQSFVVPMVVTDDSANTRTLAFGMLTGASVCIDTNDNFGGYQEFEQPPVPPSNVFDARFDSPTLVPNTPCYGQGSLVDFRPIVGPGQIDTLFAKVQLGTGGYPVHLTWPAGLTSVATSMKIVDALTGGLIYNINMLADTDTSILSGQPLDFFIIMEPIVTPGSGSEFFSVVPETLYSKNEKGKFWKAAKRAKPGKPFIAPNWGNLIAETIIQGGFGPNTSQSDSAGGMRIGIAYMFSKSPSTPLTPKWAPVKDSAAVRGWVRLTKWDFKKSLGKSFADIPKTLDAKGQKHIGVPRGFDLFANLKPFVKQQKKLLPKKHDNRLFEQIVAFKFNIAASALGKTPAGFGELIYDNDGHQFDEMSLTEIAAKIDTAMTYWQGVDTMFYWDAWDALSDINAAFVGTILDTVSWEVGPKLEMAGVVDISAVSFLKLPSPFVPARIVPANDLVEGEDWDDLYDEDEDLLDGVPTTVKLFQNYPNPFNPSTTIAFRLQSDAVVNISVYNMLGQEVGVLLSNEDMDEGINTVAFDAFNLASGVYFYKVTGQSLESGENLIPVVGKMVLMK